jgi:3-oxoacyl-[acyl-carrier protein] reductase
MSANGSELAGQVAIVTGAGSGIGAATARLLVSRGASVIVADRDELAGERVASAIRESGGQSIAVATDVSDPASISAMADVARQHGPISILVNSAGVTGPLGRKTHELAIEQFDSTLAVNLRGAVLATMEVLPDMIAAEYGRIVHVASIAGKEGNPGMTPYDASKAGLIGFVKGVAKEYATQGITVNAVAPAVIRGPMAEGEPQETIDYMLSRIPMHRMGEPTEVAEVIAFAASPACSFTTGFVFDATGGRATY